MTGPEHILDAEDGGLYRATSDSFDITEVSRDLGYRFELLEVDKKPYPCCRSTHCAIDAILQICKKHDPIPDEIESILVRTYEIGVKQCGTPRYPKTSTEAKFSTPYTVASALYNKDISLEQFTVESIDNENLRKLANKVQVVESRQFTERYPKHWGCSVEVNLSNGSTLAHEVTDASGSIYNPLTSEQAQSKFLNLCSAQLGIGKSEKILEDLLNIEQKDRLPLL